MDIKVLKEAYGVESLTFSDSGPELWVTTKLIGAYNAPCEVVLPIVAGYTLAMEMLNDCVKAIAGCTKEQLIQGIKIKQGLFKFKQVVIAEPNPTFHFTLPDTSGRFPWEDDYNFVDCWQPKLSYVEPSQTTYR